MTIYEELKLVASDLLKEFKQGIINLVKITPGNGPADNPGSPTSVNHVLDAVVRGVSFRYVKQGLAVITDLEVTSAVVDGVTPSEKDFISIDSVTYKIVQMMSVPSAGTKVVWKFIVRKGG